MGDDHLSLPPSLHRYHFVFHFVIGHFSVPRLCFSSRDLKWLHVLAHCVVLCTCCPISSSLEEYQKKSRRDALYAPTLVSLQLTGPKLLKGPQSYFHFAVHSPQSQHPAFPGKKKNTTCMLFLIIQVFIIVVINVGSKTKYWEENAPIRIFFTAIIILLLLLLNFGFILNCPPV